MVYNQSIIVSTKYMLRQGDDKSVEVSLLDIDNGTLPDLTTYAEVQLHISYKGFVLTKYTTNAVVPVGYEAMTIDVVNTNKLMFNITREISKLYPVGTLRLDVLTIFDDGLGNLTHKTFIYDNYLYVQDSNILT